MNQAEAILMGLRIWGSIGAVVAAIFLTIGMDRIDEDAREAYIFRPLLIPGVLVIWPLVLWRWYLYEGGRDQWARRYDPPRRAHFAVGWLLPIGICLIILAGLSQRQTWPADLAPVQLSAPAEVSQ
ncbi:hypothetical protein [Roseobacter sinensis]|uniref:Uncharacterized protein n=1 Tax=Roseobacter sinensis TaxID=2931391 RepID=A0ABT3BHN9_9RHOB|nr:hypothetical protein [Roseobacter sp. WL0113]MCV3273062.1 hypothetical protein [Roseobacter sp. WL0113]